MVTTLNTGAMGANASATGEGSKGSNTGLIIVALFVVAVAAYFGYEYYQDRKKVKELEERKDD